VLPSPSGLVGFARLRGEMRLVPNKLQTVIDELIGVINHPSIVPVGLPLKAALLLLISLVRFEVLVGRVNSLPELSIDIF